MISLLLNVLSTIILVLLTALHVLQLLTQKEDEPPMVENSLPFFGPIIQMIRCKSQFYRRMSTKFNLPAHTLRLPGVRFYVLNELSLIQAAQKQHHVINFGPIMGNAIGRIAGTTGPTNEIMNKNVLAEDGFLLGFNKAILHTMAPGAILDALSKKAASALIIHIDRMKLETPMPHQVSLSKLTRKIILIATTDAVYGSHNPFRDPAVEAAWWIFEPGITALVLRLIPAFATRKTRQAREVLVRAFTTYFNSGCPEDASDFMKARYNHIIQHGISEVQEIARLEVAGAFSIITNSAPTALWLLYRIYSDPATLRDCRREVLIWAKEQDNALSLDLTTLRSECPILHSALHEVLRFYGVAQSIRTLVEDHKLDDTYLLRKGNILMMPATVQHFDPSVWGADAHRFNPKRFTKLSADGSERNFDVKLSTRAAFRGFGGGLHMCPGKHFATTEILSVAAIFLIQFDVVSVNGGGWPELRRENLSSKGSAIIMPDHDLDVMISLRDEKKLTVA